jgi:hypothetical protein
MLRNHKKPLRSILIRAGLLCLLSPLSSSHTSVAQVPRLADGDLGGVVTEIDADQVKIKTIANEPFTIVFAANTMFSKQIGTSFSMKPAKVSDIHVGNSINVIGHLDPDGITKHAKIVMILSAERSQQVLSHGGMGISSVNGTITAIHGTKLTITRPDNVSQVIEVNEQTVFLKGDGRAIAASMYGASNATSQTELKTIRLADIKAGDRVLVAGGLKFPATTAMRDNIFVASTLGVQTLAAQPNAGVGTTPKR